MNFVVINASPRKNMNTSKLVNSSIDELTENQKSYSLYHLYDMNFRGCYSCFACKKEHSSSYGKCIINDDLKKVFDEIHNCDALILATPIYYRDVTGEMRSFLERLLFQSTIYSNPPRSIFGKRIKVGIIYTMNIMEQQYQNYPLKTAIEAMESSISNIGDVNSFFCFGTNQLNDYSGIEYTYFNSEERLKRHKEEFPKEIERVKNFTRSLF